MPHLDDLTRLLTGPVSLACPRMTLLCRDFEPALVEGSGTFTIVNEREFEYRLTGTPADLGHAMRVINRAREDRYDTLSQFRLILVDENGDEWNAGWTMPEFNVGENGWTFSGTCDALMGGGSTEPDRAGAEARFIIPRNHSASAALHRLIRTEVRPGEWDAARTIEVLGSPVSFRFDRATGVLAISTPHTEAMPAHSAENWLGEPLRVLFGQLVFPRLVERRFADGESMLWVRRSPAWTRDSVWLAMWDASDPTTEDLFFDLYRDLLTMVVRTGLWGSHTVTAYFEEVIQAMRGSRWVWAMTMASSIEGIARILVPEETRRADADPAAIAGLIEHIDTWVGPQRLRDTARSAVGRADKVSVVRGLIDLADQGVGSRAQVETWRRLRNQVMHGEFVSNYSTEEDDAILLNLSDLLRALTREAARRAMADTLEQPILESSDAS